MSDSCTFVDLSLPTLMFKARFDTPTAFLSNFYPHVKHIKTAPQPANAEYLFQDDKGMKFSSVEHFYQFHKYLLIDPAYAERIRDCETALDVKRLAGKGNYVSDKYLNHNSDKRLKKVIASKFDKKLAVFRDEHSLEVMREGLKYKFTQNPSLKQALLNTGDHPLAEYGQKPSDYWGHTGQSMLGRLLMELRQQLRVREERVEMEMEIVIHL